MRKKFLIYVMAIILLLTGSIKVSAQGMTKVMQAVSSDEIIKAYVKGVDADDSAEYQIGNIKAEEIKALNISGDDMPMRTLIMLDNSISIPKASRTQIAEIIKSIIDAHGENEQFRLATFSEEIQYLSDKYSDDYTALKNMTDSIAYNDQETYLTDVLYDILDELNEENYMGYTRLIIFSDGVDNKPIGVTREELNKKLEDTPYPIYSIGIDTGKNSTELENMFALSRLTAGDYIILQEDSSDVVIQYTSADNELSVYEITIPEAAKTGGKVSSKLTLNGSTSLVFPVEVPFSIKPESNPIPDPVPAPVPEADKDISVNEQTEKTFWLKWEYLIGLAIAVIAAILIVVLALRKRSKKEEKAAKEPITNNEPNYETKTELISELTAGKDRGTVMLTPGDAESRTKSYKLTLTDTAEYSRTFRCELVNTATFGRRPDNDLAIGDDMTVHGHHGEISVKNALFYMMDLKEVKNHSRINGVELKPGIPQLIVNNTKITIGRHTYVVNIEEQA